MTDRIHLEIPATAYSSVSLAPSSQETLPLASHCQATIADDIVRSGSVTTGDFFERTLAGRAVAAACFSLAMGVYLIAYSTKVAVCLALPRRAEQFA